MKVVGVPFDSGTWEGVEDVIYTGAGGGEALWLYISIALCVVALLGGAVHEGNAYRQAEQDNPDL